MGSVVRQGRKKNRCTVVLHVLLACATACASLVWAQCAWAGDAGLDVSQYAHTSWKVRDGFTKGAIYAIAQTPDGYLWLGTEFGLYRFDGVRAVPWQPPNGEQLLHVWSLVTSRDGTLWIGTSRGLFSWKDAKLTQYQGFAGRVTASLLEDREGTIWVGEWEPQLDGRLCAIRNGAAECRGGLGRGVLSFYEDRKGNLWAGSEGGFWHWKPGPPKFYPLGTVMNTAQSFAEDADGALLIAVPRMGIYRLVEGIQQPQYALPNTQERGSFYRMLRVRDGALWIALNSGGLLHVSEDRTDGFMARDGLSGDAVWAIFEDREGSIWAASMNGLDRFRKFAIPTWSERQGLPFAPGSAVLAARDGSIWTGSLKGMGRLNEGQLTVYRRQRGTRLTSRDVREIIRPDLPDSFEAFFQDRRGRIWVLSLDGRVGYVEDQQYHAMRSLGTNTLISAGEDSQGDLWIGAREAGLFRLHEGEIAEKVSWAGLGRKAGEICDRLAVDPLRAGVWIACRSGGITHFKDGRVRASYSATDGLGAGVVNDLRFDSSGTLWAATESGLSRIKDERITTLTSKSGLPCDTVHWTIEDDDHFVWLYMACGLVRIARNELDAWAGDTKNIVRPTTFDASDGARIEALPTGASPQVSKGPDGKIWFVSLDGISVIDPRHLPSNHLRPPVQVEQITADRRTYGPASYGNGRVLLPARTRDLEIEYTALSLAVPEKVRFRYKLEGRDRDWVDAGNRRQAFYSDLPPRNYRFRVAACNNSGVWNEEGAFLDFSIAPTYYQTNWFRALCVAGFLALLWALYELRVRGIQREFNVGLEERLKERTRIARELHDTLLQNLHGLLFRFQAARNLFPRRPAEAMETLDEAIAKTEQAITESQDAITDLRPAADSNDLGELVRAAGKELETTGNGNGTAATAATFALTVEGMRQSLSPILQEEVYRIALELLRNAFRHASAHRVEAEVRYDDERLRVLIRDDGKGMDPEVLKKGRRPGHWGLLGAKERAQAIGAHLDIWSEVGAGTEIQISVPAAIAYKNSHDRPKLRLFRGVRS